VKLSKKVKAVPQSASSKKKSTSRPEVSAKVVKTAQSRKKSAKGQKSGKAATPGAAKSNKKAVGRKPVSFTTTRSAIRAARAAEAAKARKRVQDARIARQLSERQVAHYEAAVGYLNLKKFAQARSRFEKAADGPDVALRHRAKVYAEICRSRIETSKLRLKSADDYYNYGIRLMNDRQVDEAEHHLGEALKRDPNADHVHYATAVLQAIKGDTAGVHRSLSRAIELNPRNRPLALNDSDLATVREDPSISDLLRPQRPPPG
jgi:tetratricopeptide (TPR) repeat protein